MMTRDIRQLTIGQAQVTAINVGDLYLPLKTEMNISEDVLAQREGIQPLLDLVQMPVYCVCVELPQTTILIDAGCYDVENYPQYALPDYTPPPSLIDSLASIRVTPEQIDHVILTHAHWDHFNGTTTEENGQFVPQFPNATYYLSQADWDASQSNVLDPSTPEYNTLRVLNQQNVLTLLNGETEIIEGVTVIPAPAETKGHYIVRVASDGEVVYCVGDLYNHPLEFRYPDLMVAWSDFEDTTNSREMFIPRAIADSATIIASHIREIGQLIPTKAGERWQAI